MQDLLDHGEARKRQEEAEFARIDAEAKDQRDKQAGLRGKVRPPSIARLRVTNIPRRSSMFWMVRITDPLGQSQRLGMVSRTG